ncbi:MAG: chloride channel protein [Clostridia bacterium]|nr:chloride channel protein [Clostridia bacterium]
MSVMKETCKIAFQYIRTLLKWVLIAAITGAVGGIIGTAFHKCLDYVTDFRMHNTYITYFMPLGIIVIIAMYNIFGNKGKLNTNLIINSVRKEEKIPLVIVPVIFLGTVITQFFGGSAGREGAALQLGGGIGYTLGKVLKLNKNDIHIITMAGMGSVFSALFSTPVTAAIFSIEVISVGAFNFTALLPCILASVIAFHISSLLGVKGEVFFALSENVSWAIIAKVIILSVCCAVISILFCLAIKRCGQLMKKCFKNPYLRGVVGASILVALTVAVGTFDYNGAGMNIVERALSGDARGYDFIMKIIFTAITIAAGFKGGEIVPAFFVGATFGCVMGPLLGIGSEFAAAIGMVAVFCGVVNCPIASIILSVEMFGADGIALFAIACAVSYIMSGHSGLYKSQNIVYSKLTADTIEDKGN